MKTRNHLIVNHLRTGLKKMHKYIKNLWARLNRHLGKMWVRLVVLLIAAAIGAALVKWASPWFLCFFPVSVYGDIRTIIGAAPFTLPVFLALWWFRTYDSFQGDWRANFEAGVAHIASDTPIRIEIGTVILINIAEATSSYDREIRTTFIRRLKRSPADTDKNHEMLTHGYRFAYAQHMLKWLQIPRTKKDKNKKYDLNLLDLRYQEFTRTTSGITIREVLNMHSEAFLTLDVGGTLFEADNKFFESADNVYGLYVREWTTHARTIGNRSHSIHIRVGYADKSDTLDAEVVRKYG